jgi:hypothetical protein
MVILAAHQARRQHFPAATQTQRLKGPEAAAGLALSAVLVLMMVLMLLVATVVLERFGQ